MSDRRRRGKLLTPEEWEEKMRRDVARIQSAIGKSRDAEEQARAILEEKREAVNALFRIAGQKAKKIRDAKTFFEWRRRFWDPAYKADCEVEGRPLPWRLRRTQ